MAKIAPNEKIVTAESSRRAAQWMDIGNLITTFSPIVLPFWLVVSLMIFFSHRHHANKRVDHHTQLAAYRFYGFVGIAAAIAMMIPADMRNYLILWAVLAIILIPWTLVSLRNIRKEQWHDMTYTKNSDSKR